MIWVKRAEGGCAYHATFFEEVRGMQGLRVMENKTGATQTVGYTLRDSRYLNITNRCTLRCAFCPKFNGEWTVQDYPLRLTREPTLEEIVAAAGNPEDYREIVFCGLGEPTLRLYTLLEAAARLRPRTKRIRLNTDGLANLVYGRDVTPDMEGLIDALSVSLNAQDAETYNLHCRPKLPGAFEAVLDFVKCARDFVPEITLTAIDGLPGVDVVACEKIAQRLGVHFRRRVLDVVG
ncbi:MAG TPA: TatD family nuclease-associated radical SAM protein [Candidatus Methylomirabilis sp.]|nr:TatD family nuclease-associated radical SAM protein [Candidatus Methylomirabilis sp.]